MEQEQRQKLVKTLNKRPYKRHAVSVENPACPGTPDIAYISGWIECKYLANWPVREDTNVVIDHYTKQQRIWHIQDWHFGGACWLCLQVSKTRDWLVYDGFTAGKFLAKPGCDRAKTLALAVFHGHSAAEVVEYILGNDNAHFNRISD